MSTTPTSTPDRETFWQMTAGSFLGVRVRVKLRTGTYLEGEFKDPRAYTVQLELLAGGTRLIEYSTVLEVEEAQ